MNHAIHLAEDAPSADAIEGFRKGMAPFWHPVLDSAALGADRPVGVVLLGRRLVLARLNGAVAALPDTCRHFQAQLSLGRIVGLGDVQGLQCAYHGWTFDGGGRCLRIPQLPPERSVPKSANLPPYHATEKYGLIWVCLAEEPRFPIPDFPEFDDPAYRKHRLDEAEPTRTSATRMIMGTLDDTHLPWVHDGILGHSDQPAPPDHRVWREGNELIVRYEASQPAGVMTADMSRPDIAAGDTINLVYTDHVGMPNVIRLVKETPHGRYVIWLATCPVDYDRTRNFWQFARDYDLEPARDEIYQAMSAHVRSQDKPVIESQRPWLLPPFWTRLELPIAPGDLPLVEYQKWAEELGIVTAI